MVQLLQGPSGVSSAGPIPRARPRPRFRKGAGMMKKVLVLRIALTGLFALCSLPARAQVAGTKGRFAAGFEAGAAFPFEGDYATGWTAAGSFDYSVAPRVALRASAGYARFSTPFADPFTRGALLGSVVYQFDLGAVRPYGRAGLGLYVVSPPVGSTRSRLGAHLGGGVEWLLGPRTALTGELLVDLLGSAEDRSTSSVTLTAGFRYYF